MYMKIESITPDQASAILQEQPEDSNRVIRLQLVDRIASDITAGRWQLNGETIIFNGKLLLDGQHRLAACVKANKPIETIVVYGAASQVRATIDTGAKRTGSDVLRLELHERHATALASAIGWVWRYRKGDLWSQQSIVPTSSELLLLLDAEPEIRTSISFGYGLKRLLPTGMAIGCHFLMAKKDQHLADQFFTELGNGIYINEVSATYVLRERLLNNAAAKAKLRTAYLGAITIKAWNALRINRKISQLKFQDEEPFPEIM